MNERFEISYKEASDLADRRLAAFLEKELDKPNQHESDYYYKMSISNQIYLLLKDKVNVFRYRIPNYAGGDAVPPPMYDVHCTSDILNCRHIRLLYGWEAFVKLWKRDPKFYSARPAWDVEIVAEVNFMPDEKLHWLVSGIVIRPDFAIDLPMLTEDIKARINKEKYGT